MAFPAANLVCGHKHGGRAGSACRKRKTSKDYQDRSPMPGDPRRACFF